MENIKTGVGLILIAKETGRILVMKELRDKPEIEKKAGMVSFPLETMKNGEQKEETVQRLIEEEIGVSINCNVCLTFFGDTFLIVKNAKTLAAFAYCEKEFVPNPEDDDIEFFGWLHPKELLHPQIFVRKEVRQIISLFLSLSKA